MKWCKRLISTVVSWHVSVSLVHRSLSVIFMLLQIAVAVAWLLK